MSMGNASGLKAWQVVANSERALAIELLAGAQAVEFLAPLEPGRGARAAHELRAVALAAAARRPPARRPTSRPSPTRSATARSSLPSRPRSESSHEAACRLARGCRERPLPKHPYRDTAIVYGVLRG